MGVWTDIAVWRGPTVNQSGRMVAQNGVILHIAEGSYEGTIAWQKNPAAQVSSHFVTDFDGKLAQVVDTDITAWTQAAGNGRWLSIENAGFHTDQFTPGQIEACAKVVAKGHQVYGYPLQLTDSPNIPGLGWHGMGGAAWGGHYDCPGPKNVALRSQILNRAIEIAGGTPPQEEDEEMGIRGIIIQRASEGIALLYPHPVTGEMVYANVGDSATVGAWTSPGPGWAGPVAVTQPFSVLGQPVAVVAKKVLDAMAAGGGAGPITVTPGPLKLELSGSATPEA